MPPTYNFSEGSESRDNFDTTPNPRLSRFRIPSSETPKSVRTKLFGTWGRSGSRYGTVPQSEREEGSEDEDDRWSVNSVRLQQTLWSLPFRIMNPTKEDIAVLVETWWSRLFVLVFVPVFIVVGWCAIPLKTTDLHDGAPWDLQWFDRVLNWIASFFYKRIHQSPQEVFVFANATKPAGPGHGEAIVEINFWSFLSIYYGFYTLVGLIYMSCLFNMYNLNWWPTKLGGIQTTVLSWLFSVLLGIPVYYLLPSLAPLNMTWILLTFLTMCTPAIIAFIVLFHEDRHSSLRYHQRTAVMSPEPPDSDDEDGVIEPTAGDLLAHYAGMFSSLTGTLARSRSLSNSERRRPAWRNMISHRVQRRTQWIPQSYVRFLWFCAAIAVSLLAFVLGELYAEIYLRTLPHDNLKDAAIYVYSWVVTIFALDGLTGWILGARVCSYPLGFVFKLYFSLTYQTYVRALYARLRSPTQFAFLQLISSSIVLIIQPITMTGTLHRLLVYTGLSGQPYDEYRKHVGRALYLRSLSENVSMLAFLGWICVLHFGPNRRVYPYLSFDTTEAGNGGYTFELTFWASCVTWACEMVADWLVRRIMGWWFGFGVTGEGKRDFVDFPELVVGCVVVMVHVLQNMLFSIVRLRFQ